MATRHEALDDAVNAAYSFLEGEKIGACIVDHLYKNPNISIKSLLKEVNVCENKKLDEKRIRKVMMELSAYGLMTNYTNGHFALGKIGKQVRSKPDFDLLHAAS